VDGISEQRSHVVNTFGEDIGCGVIKPVEINLWVLNTFRCLLFIDLNKRPLPFCVSFVTIRTSEK
jgi:hypothetical protein